MEAILTIIFSIITTQNILNYQQNATNLWQFNYVDIIYRQERGANDNRLFRDDPKYQEVEKKIQNYSVSPAAKYEERLKDQRITYLEKNFPDEYEINKQITNI
jgi:hypothetical protein